FRDRHPRVAQERVVRTQQLAQLGAQLGVVTVRRPPEGSSQRRQLLGADDDRLTVSLTGTLPQRVHCLLLRRRLALHAHLTASLCESVVLVLMTVSVLVVFGSGGVCRRADGVEGGGEQGGHVGDDRCAGTWSLVGEPV